MTENCDWPAVRRLQPCGDEKVEIEIFLGLDLRGASQGANWRNNALIGFIVWRTILAESDRSHRAGNDLQRFKKNVGRVERWRRAHLALEGNAGDCAHRKYCPDAIGAQQK